MVVKSILLIISAGFLTFTAGSWAFVFWFALRYGSCKLYEPSKSILVAEFSLAVLLSCIGLAAFIYSLSRARKEV